MKCDNCDRAAIYKIAPGIASPVYYCNLHLPEFLRSTVETGGYEVEAPAPSSSKKKSTPVVPEEAPTDATE